MGAKAVEVEEELLEFLKQYLVQVGNQLPQFASEQVEQVRAWAVNKLAHIQAAVDFDLCAKLAESDQFEYLIRS